MSPLSVDLVNMVQIICLDNEQRPLSEALVNLDTKTINEMFTFEEIATPTGEVALNTDGMKHFTEKICNKIIS